MHLVGNLNYTIGTLIGNTGYVRNREQEFSLTGVPQHKLIADIEATTVVVKSSLQDIDQAKLEETYPVEMIGKHSTAFYLNYMHSHLNYHLGQINYLRRILEQ